MWCSVNYVHIITSCLLKSVVLILDYKVVDDLSNHGLVPMQFFSHFFDILCKI